MRRTIRRPSDDSSKVDELPMTPMIDIIFQLLIFFMCSMHFKELEGKLTSWLPKEGPAPSNLHVTPPPEIRIVMSWDAAAAVTHLSVERNPVGEARFDRERGRDLGGEGLWRTLGDRVERLWTVEGGRPDARVVIDATRDVPWAHVIRTMDACKARRIDRIAFAADPANERR